MELFELLKDTEVKICGQHYPPRGTRKGAVGLWKDLKNGPFSTKLHSVSLEEINDDWNLLLNVRDAESEGSSQKVLESIELTKRLKQNLNAHWYIVKLDTTISIGEIGIVPFECEGFKIGRLQNVEIAVSYRGLGFGNMLLGLIENKGLELGLSALCLKARSDDWPLGWYKKFGYEEVGQW